MKERMEIYATLGPSCADPETLRRMFAEGITGMRLNLSHGSLALSSTMIDAFHRAEDLEGVHISLLIEMQGPELRIGHVAKNRMLTEGEDVLLYDKRLRDSDDSIPIPKEVIRNYMDGMILLIDDGKISLRAEQLIQTGSKTQIKASVLTGGALKSRKSIAVKDMAITGDTLTEQDLMNLKEAVSYGVTDVMQPFVRGASDLRTVKSAMREAGAGNCRLFAKIENRTGVAALSEILPETDMLVIARGDLGNAMPLWELPYVQKEISAECLKHHVPFMVVTQMLASMENSPVPTRAEVSDIFNAVADGASAVMITGESASGNYPVQASSYLVKTAMEGLRWRERNA